ncbi:MAG: polyribonucleotide nucleotidyltransferase [Thermovirgaceae bacterium]|nr:polyribonucleotide nucleotidyltransferase [Thermovirgaceae bacterium]
MSKIFTIEVGGRTLTFETGKLAKQANGSVQVTQGETSVLVTACIADKAREGLDFLPLLVDYEERFYSAGKIPGGFIKREGRPSETATLTCRIIDRSIRSLFPGHIRNDIHVVATTLSVDQSNPPNILAINGASAALMLSGIPWGGPVGAVRIGRIDGELVVNPTEEMMKESSLDLVVSGHSGGITMVEAGAKEVPEDVLVDALELAQQEISKIVQLYSQMAKAAGKPLIEIPEPPAFPEIDTWVGMELRGDILNAVQIHDKKPRGDAIDSAMARAKETLLEQYPGAEFYIGSAVEGLVKKTMRARVVEDGKRADGRAMDEIRPITCEVGVLPRVHGSALFTRGETQALVTTTLGMIGEDDQLVDGLKHDEPSKRFMLHYNFPPFSVGEVRPMRGPGRREIGHGSLAERAVRVLMPGEEAFPYAVRVVSDILESNGSSSMASVCGASLALMDAGVPIAKPVAGVAMGLIKEGEKVAILSDIQGLEDHYGDMDFKVTGTRDGVTALQMDNKAGGITRGILQSALEQACRGRLFILDRMETVLSAPREEVSTHAPRIYTITVALDKIRDIIGAGGKTIRSIVAQTGVKIDVEDDGRVFVASPTREAAEKALAIIHDLVREVAAGEVFSGKVTRLMAFGAFVEILPGKEGLLHVSEISTTHIGKVDDVLSSGDIVLVVVKEIDDMGRINLSRRRILERKQEPELAEKYADAFLLEDEREARIKELPPSSPSDRGDRNSRGGSPRPGDRRPQSGPRRSGSSDRNRDRS